MNFETLKVNFQEQICFIQLYRPQAMNSINQKMIEEFHKVLDMCEEKITVVVVEGLPEVFCFGADFQEIHDGIKNNEETGTVNQELLYDLWLRLASGPYVTISHVRGKANAGGVGFIAACDMVIADKTAQFSLSELLFGLYPACVLPFLIRRVGFQKANYLTLMTNPVLVEQAFSWGLVDAFDTQSQQLLGKHLMRLRYLPKTGITRYKRYISSLYNMLEKSKDMAVAANREVFLDPRNLDGIFRYMETGKFMWMD